MAPQEQPTRSRLARLLAATLGSIACASWLAHEAAAQAPSPPGSPSPVVTPAAPADDDPLLAAPPPAPRVLASWTDALAQVRLRSPDYLTTYHAVLRAEAQSQVALAGILPSLSGTGSFTHQLFTTTQSLGNAPIMIPAQDVLAVGASFTWQLGDLRAWYAVGTGKRMVDVSHTELSERRRTIAKSIASSMIATLAAARASELARNGLRSSHYRLALAEARIRAQSGTELDRYRAQEDVEAARAVVVTADEALLRSREALGLALGDRIATSAPGDLDLAAFVRAVASTCQVDQRIDQRPDVIAARQRLEIAKRSVRDVRLQYVPSLSLQSQLAWSTDVLYGPTVTWSLQGVLSVPLWDGGAREGVLRGARAAVAQSKVALEQ
ncbi:MAG TPA: TolC family protein, partial [Kofleriaceae bacterium]|nr:TolC family protein [Kofleriaceae bacterium]